jgi:S1-C subfamily serine protease
MAGMLLGAVVTSDLQPRSAQASSSAFGAPALAAPPQAARPTGPVTLDTFRDIARLQTPGVVNINTKKTVKRSSRGGQQGRDMRDFFGDDFMDRFFGQDRGGEPQTQRSLGSGFIVDKEATS